MKRVNTVFNFDFKFHYQPKKMGTNANDSTAVPRSTSDLLKSLTDIENQHKELGGKGSNAKTLTHDDVKKTVLPALFMVCKELLNKLGQVEEKNVGLAAENNSLRSRVAELEFANCKNSVKIDGLKLHKKSKDGEESSVQSNEVVQKLIKDLGVTDCTIANSHRIPSAKAHLPPIMIVNFASSNDKSKFFGKIKNLKNPNLTKEYRIYVNQQYPKALNDRLKELNNIAKKKRDDDPDLRTSIRFSKGNLYLHTKEGSNEWVKFSED